MATKTDYLETIRKWKHFWMNQTQNSEEDRKNYFDRAFGIDSNMVHHLADMLAGKETAVDVFDPKLLKGYHEGCNYLAEGICNKCGASVEAIKQQDNSLHEYSERCTLELAASIIKLSKARKALESAEWFMNHVMGKEKRVDWGKTFDMDWGKVNEALIAVSSTLKELTGEASDTKSN